MRKATDVGSSKGMNVMPTSTAKVVEVTSSTQSKKYSITNVTSSSLEVKVDNIEGRPQSTERVTLHGVSQKFVTNKMEIEYLNQVILSKTQNTRYMIGVAMVAVIGFLVLAYTNGVPPRLAIQSITCRVILLVASAILIYFTYTKTYSVVFINYPFIIVIWITFIACGLLVSRVLDDDNFRTGSMLTAHLLIQSGIILAGGFTWNMNMFIILLEYIFYITGASVADNFFPSIYDMALSNVILYASLGTILYAYVARVMDISNRSSFILTNRLKRERIDLHFQLEGVKIFDAADKVGRTRALDVVIDPSSIILEDVVGAGSFGEVRKGNWQHTAVAVKNIHGNAIANKKILIKFHEEASIMSKLRHPNVVQFLGVCIHPPMLVMELMQRGSMFHILQNKKMDLHWTLLISIALDAASGMNFLHLNKPAIIHQDLKSRNLLVTGDWKVKISDFGLSSLKFNVNNWKRRSSADFTNKPPDSTPITNAGAGRGELGTLPWTAPELFNDEEATEKCDVYSYGVILYELLTREVPWAGTPQASIQHLVTTGKRPGGNHAISVDEPVLKQLIALMENCWVQQPRDRPSFNSICIKLESIINGYVNSMPPKTTWADVIVLPGAPQSFIVSNNDQETGALREKEENQQPSFNIEIKDIMIGPKIGKGSYAIVYEGKYAGTHVAVKEIIFDGSAKDVIKEFNKECQLMLKFRHPNIVLFMGNSISETKLYMVTELLVRGSVHQIYKANKPIENGKKDIDLCLSVSADGARGMQYLHSLSPPLIHRDLKSPNVLLDENYVAKIADFGLSRFKDDSKTMTMVGSPLWVAPEVLRGERFGEPCDVFSFGIIIWELMAWEEPYPGLSSNAVMRGVAGGKLRPEKKKNIPSTLWDLLEKMWGQDPKLRPPFSQVLSSLEKMKAASLAASKS